MQTKARHVRPIRILRRSQSRSRWDVCEDYSCAPGHDCRCDEQVMPHPVIHLGASSPWRIRSPRSAGSEVFDRIASSRSDVVHLQGREALCRASRVPAALACRCGEGMSPGIFHRVVPGFSFAEGVKAMGARTRSERASGEVPWRVPLFVPPQTVLRAFRASVACAALTEKPLVPRVFPRGEVAERLKAAVC